MLIDHFTLSQHFTHGSPKGVIHVGAHAAEELCVYDSLGINNVIWVEANPSLLPRLISKTKNHPGSSVHNFAAFNIDDSFVELNVANNGESSSILEFGTHSVEHPHIHYVDKVKVPTLTIDTFINRNGYDRDLFDFLNLDIQGAELIALKGMQTQLKNVKYAYLEVNEKHLYKECHLMNEIDDFLKNFNLVRRLTKMTQHGWGDALYVKDLV